MKCTCDILKIFIKIKLELIAEFLLKDKNDDDKKNRKASLLKEVIKKRQIY